MRGAWAGALKVEEGVSALATEEWGIGENRLSAAPKLESGESRGGEVLVSEGREVEGRPLGLVLAIKISKW